MNRREFLGVTATGLGGFATLKTEVLPAGEGGTALQREEFDIAPFGRRCGVENRHMAPVMFNYPAAERAGSGADRAPDGQYIYALQWAEERDIKEVRVRFKTLNTAPKAIVEYWYGNWPYPPPHMPTAAVLRDDAWQGKWLQAATRVVCGNSECRYLFEPLEESENPRAGNLPGVDYRRTLKIRLVFAAEAALDGVQIFTGSVVKPVRIRMELGAGESDRYEWKGGVRVYNGELNGVKLWQGSAGDSANGRQFRVATEGSPKGIWLDLTAAKPSLPGSEDITIVTLDAGKRTFSFAVPDLEKGPIYVPGFHSYVTMASDERTFSPSMVKTGLKIRERIAQEPEQSYERASKEIPPLNPALKEETSWSDGRAFVPLAAEASWQKFAVEWGGNIFLTKKGIRADFLGQMERLEWEGDSIAWRIGTGAMPNFRPLWEDSTLSVLDDYLPVAIANWSTDGIEYSEESFATLLMGELSPENPGRSEATPAVMMLKVGLRNPGSSGVTAHVWLATDPVEEVLYQNGELLTQEGDLVRARVTLSAPARAARSSVAFGDRTLQGIHAELMLAPGERNAIFISIPFIPRLTPEQRARLAELDYETERARVVSYWREVVAATASFEVPDQRVTKITKALVPHILMDVIKHPQTGLYYVPCGTIYEGMASNEGVGQCLMLDALGHSHRASMYFETWIRTQAKVPIPGAFSNQRGVFNAFRSWEAYGLNAGSVLGGLAEHYFFTRDREWLGRVAPSMKLAADWMIEQRRLTRVLDGGQKVPEYGLLPACKMEDPSDWGHWVAVNAEAVAGITRLADALADIGAPEAAHYAEEAAAYKRDLREAVIRSTQQAAVVQLRDNTYVPYVPTRVHQRVRGFGPIGVGYYSRYERKVIPLYRDFATREVYAGPIYLLLRGIFRVDEPLADWILDDWEDNLTMSVPLGINVHGWVDEKYWFSQGGMVFQPTRNPAPIYLQRNEIPAAIRSVYNSFVATHYPDMNCLAEEYHQWGHGAGSLVKTFDEGRLTKWFRQMLVREEGAALLLASGVPRRWLVAGEQIQLKGMPTSFGPVSYEVKAAESGVEAQIELPTRNKFETAWFIVRAPDGKKIRAVEIDGKSWTEFDPASERIRIPPTDHPLHVSAHF